MNKVLVTGVAGFIGFHVCQALLERNVLVVGIDNLNDYYEIDLKKARLKLLGVSDTDVASDRNVPGKGGFVFKNVDIVDQRRLDEIFKDSEFDTVIHLAAQAGVRYSLVNPRSYIENNLIGFYNTISLANEYGVEHFIFASSSSVYGLNNHFPASTQEKVDSPTSLYAATKKSNELIAHTFAHLGKMRTTGLRFFTVYGPWGRPDMAYFSFTKAIMEGKTINLFNNGKMQRDFTYVSDIVDGIVALAESPSGGLTDCNYRIYNLGNSRPVELLDFVREIEGILGKKAVVDFQPLQPGDVVSTFADISESERDFGFRPKVPLQEGLRKFIGWFRGYYKV